MDTLVPSHKLFHSFCIKPQSRFEAQGDEEHIYVLVRAHPILLIFPFLNAFFFIFLLLFANFFFSSLLNVVQVLFVNVFVLVTIFNYAFFHYLNWYFNIGIITNRQIVDIDFHVVLYKQITYTQLSHVEDVTAKSGGFFESYFDFGNVFVQTAGTEANTEFMNVPHPSSIAKIINGLLMNPHK